MPTLEERRKKYQAALARFRALAEGRSAAAQAAASKPKYIPSEDIDRWMAEDRKKGGASTSDVSSTSSSSRGRSKFVDDMIGGATTAANSLLLGVPEIMSRNVRDTLKRYRTEHPTASKVADWGTTAATLLMPIGAGIKGAQAVSKLAAPLAQKAGILGMSKKAISEGLANLSKGTVAQIAAKNAALSGGLELGREMAYAGDEGRDMSLKAPLMAAGIGGAGGVGIAKVLPQVLAKVTPLAQKVGKAANISNITKNVKQIGTAAKDFKGRVDSIIKTIPKDIRAGVKDSVQDVVQGAKDIVNRSKASILNRQAEKVGQKLDKQIGQYADLMGQPRATGDRVPSDYKAATTAERYEDLLRRVRETEAKITPRSEVTGEAMSLFPKYEPTPKRAPAATKEAPPIKFVDAQIERKMRDLDPRIIESLELGRNPIEFASPEEMTQLKGIFENAKHKDLVKRMRNQMKDRQLKSVENTIDNLVSDMDPNMLARVEELKNSMYQEFDKTAPDLKDTVGFMNLITDKHTKSRFVRDWIKGSVNDLLYKKPNAKTLDLLQYLSQELPVSNSNITLDNATRQDIRKIIGETVDMMATGKWYKAGKALHYTQKQGQRNIDTARQITNKETYDVEPVMEAMRTKNTILDEAIDTIAKENIQRGQISATKEKLKEMKGISENYLRQAVEAGLNKRFKEKLSGAGDFKNVNIFSKVFPDSSIRNLEQIGIKGTEGIKVSSAHYDRAVENFRAIENRPPDTRNTSTMGKIAIAAEAMVKRWRYAARGIEAIAKKLDLSNDVLVRIVTEPEYYQKMVKNNPNIKRLKDLISNWTEQYGKKSAALATRAALAFNNRRQNREEY